MEINKKCCSCKQFFPLSDYTKAKNQTDGHGYYCIKCRKTKKAEYYQRNKTVILEKMKIYSQTEEGKFISAKAKQKYKYKKNYNFTIEEKEKLFLQQDYKCKICKRELPDLSPSFVHVDHCHTKKGVRGILCNKCNNLLGQSNDNINTLKSAIEYLKKHS